jgi:putative ABC transport system ATP-binding protein
MSGFILEGVTVAHGHTRILDEICEHIEPGRATAIVGPSGAGKSTLLRVLNRLEEPTSGQVLVDGVPLREWNVLQLRRRVGLVAQRPVLLTDQVTAELRVGAPSLREDQMVKLLESVGLAASFAQRRTTELSGGEAQRVCLARSLAVQPESLLLDEPTSALDGLNTSVVGQVAHDHVAAGGTVVVVSHDLSMVRSIASRVVVLADGRVVDAGSPGDVAYLAAGS